MERFILFCLVVLGSCEVQGEECADNDVSCPSWAGQGLCDPARDNGYMSENCRLSCQLCTRGPQCPSNQIWFPKGSCAPCLMTCTGTVSCDCRDAVCACSAQAPIAVGETCVTYDRCGVDYPYCRHSAVLKGTVLPDTDIPPREQFSLSCDKGYYLDGKRYATCGYNGALLSTLGRCLRHKL